MPCTYDKTWQYKEIIMIYVNGVSVEEAVKALYEENAELIAELFPEDTLAPLVDDTIVLDE